jgi:hypothetical protein
VVQDKLGMRFSGAYTVNGVCMTVTWFVGRIVLFLWFFMHMWNHRGQLSLLAPPALVLVLLVPPLLFALNVWWFTKILRGIAKLLGGTLSKVSTSTGGERRRCSPRSFVWVWKCLSKVRIQGEDAVDNNHHVAGKGMCGHAVCPQLFGCDSTWTQ